METNYPSIIDTHEVQIEELWSIEQYYDHKKKDWIINVNNYPVQKVLTNGESVDENNNIR